MHQFRVSQLKMEKRWRKLALAGWQASFAAECNGLKMWWRKREEDKKIIPFIVITEQLFCGTPKRFRKLATQKVCLFLSVPMTDFSSVSNFVVILFSICWFWGHAKYL